MSFSSGTYSAPSNSWNPAVTGATINSTDWATLLADLTTALSTCVLKDGTQVITANLPMAGFKLTGLGAGSASGNSLRYEQVNGIVTTAGDVLYATGAGTLARLAIGTARQQLATNAGATAPEWVASLQSLMTGTGDILQSSSANTPARLAIGTARQVPTVNAGATALAYQNPITLATQQASTSGTSIDFTSIPAGVKRITIMLVGVSISGTADLLFQIGDSGGIENSGYLGAGFNIGNAGTAAVTRYTAGWGVPLADAASVLHGAITLSLENSAAFTWVSTGLLSNSAGGAVNTMSVSGSKSTSAELDRVRITTSNGSDTFDAGVINISYE